MTNDEGSAAREIAGYSFLVVFANDGTISEDELRMMEHLALRDGQVDDEERRVLANVFARVDPATLDPVVRDEIARFRAAVGMEPIGRPGRGACSPGSPPRPPGPATRA